MIWFIILLVWLMFMALFKIWYAKRAEQRRKEILDSREIDKGRNLNAKLTAEESRKRR